MKCTIEAVTTSARLYRNYTDKRTCLKGIKKRYEDRVKWINGYLKDGSFKNKLIAIGVLKKEIEKND
jgi:hypothetical protein